MEVKYRDKKQNCSRLKFISIVYRCLSNYDVGSYKVHRIYLILLMMKDRNKFLANTNKCHCVRRFRIRSYSGPYSVQMWENTDQNNSEYGNLKKIKNILF